MQDTTEWKSKNLPVSFVKADTNKAIASDFGFRVEDPLRLRTDFRRFVVVFLLFQIVECTVLWTTVMSNERMNLEAPVLHDVVLDNLSYRSWASPFSEVLLVSYHVALCCFVVFHQRRFVIARRYFLTLIIGFSFRIVCIWCNVLPRSHYTMECSPKARNFFEIVNRVVILHAAAGMSILGGRMCGNYFFSGHALMVTNIHCLLSYYLPTEYKFLRRLSTLVAILILLTILMAHNHYTIDILGSFAVGSLTFSIFTFLAENPQCRSIFPLPIWSPIMWFEREGERIEYKMESVRNLFRELAFIIWDTVCVCRRFTLA